MVPPQVTCLPSYAHTHLHHALTMLVMPTLSVVKGELHVGQVR